MSPLWKKLMLLKYPHIESFDKMAEYMLGLPIVLEEKLDGSNFSILSEPTPDGPKITLRSRNQDVNRDESSMFCDAIKIADNIIPKIIEMTKDNKYPSSYYMEYIGQGIHNRVDYSDYLKRSKLVINDKTLVLLDIAFQIGTATKYLNVQHIDDVAEKLELTRPIYNEYILSVQLVREKSCSFKEIEGYVIKTNPRLFNHFGEPLICKIKTNWYSNYEKRGGKEHIKEKSDIAPEVFEFVNQTLNFGRLNSIYSHGNIQLKKEMADMRYLPNLILEDIKTENHEIFKTQSEDVIKKVLYRNIPKILKLWLVDNV